MMNFLLAQAPTPPPPQPLPHPELPEVFLPPVPEPTWIYAVALLALVGLLALVLWLLLRPRQAGLPEPKRPWKKAMRALKELSSKARGLPPGEVSAQVSEILRRYFFDRYQIPAPFRTTHELFDGASTQPVPRLQKYASLATLWDELSFAPAPASEEETMELLAKAISALEDDHPVQAADIAHEERVEVPLPSLDSAVSLRNLSFGLAWFYFFIAALLVCLLFFHEKSQTMWWAVLIVAALVAFLGFRNFRDASAMDPRRVEFDLDPDTPLEEQIRYYQIRLIGAPLIMLPLTAWVAYDMERLSSGEVEQVRVWAPVALLYDLFGYWGAVLVFPLFALATVVLTWSRLKVLKLHLAHQARSK